MQSKEYQIRDNGLTSFAPPCFNWELEDTETGEVMAVSKLDLSCFADSGQKQKQEQLLRELSKGRKCVAGRILQNNEEDAKIGHVIFEVQRVI